MKHLKDFDDTIAAISTPAGIGGIGIVRLSGAEAVAIAEKMFRHRKDVALRQFLSHTVHYGEIVDERGEILDEALVSVMRAPRTYTREDVVEINCHGGRTALKAVLGLAVRHGARPAEAGEFTKRAFLNGRIDLTQAEAVMDIIQAKTDASLKVSTHQLKGELTAELESIRENLMHVYTELEAVLNFPDDDTTAVQQETMTRRLRRAGAKAQELLRTSDQGRILKEGVKVVLCGRPNVGKSSLLNVLLKVPRAIVSEIPGTTRDTIEETAQIGNVPFQFIDTAGILLPRDQIEEEAVRRSRLSMKEADLVLFLLEANSAFTRDDADLLEVVRHQKVIIIVNKSDLGVKLDEKQVRAFLPGVKTIRISALHKTGIDQLKDAVLEEVTHGRPVDPHAVVINNLRHIHALQAAQTSIEKALALSAESAPQEFVSEEIKAGIQNLDQITGRDADIDLIDRIFSSFCIGK